MTDPMPAIRSILGMPTPVDTQVSATLALVEQTAALVAAQTTANRIAWTTRPGFRPSGAHIDWIESQLGLKTEAGL